MLGASAAEHSQRLWYEDLYLALLAAASGSYSFDELGASVALEDRAQRRSAWWTLVKKLSQCEESTRARLLEKMRVRLGLFEPGGTAGSNHEVQNRRFGLLNQSDLRHLVDQGMSVGSHTLTIRSSRCRVLNWRGRRLPTAAASGESFGKTSLGLGLSLWRSGVRDQPRKANGGAGWLRCAFMNVGGGFGAQLPRFAIPTGSRDGGDGLVRIRGAHFRLSQRFRSRALGRDRVSPSDVPHPTPDGRSQPGPDSQSKPDPNIHSTTRPRLRSTMPRWIT